MSMRGASTFLLLMVALSCAPGGSSGNRRILHQPFFPEDSTPPPLQPPVPSPPPPPALPFSQTTPGSSPFFPSYPSPPPPPSPSAFASFPANISSLVLPQSPGPHKTTGKLLAACLAAALSGLLFLGVFVFLYRRRRAQQARNDDVKTTTRGSEASTTTSSRVFTSMVGPPRGAGPTGRKLRANSSNSSEFLYLGTLVSSHNVEVGVAHPETDPRGNAGSDPRKIGSPELHPLPPLLLRRNLGDGDVTSTADDDEEFYSPKGSLGTESGSRRVLAAQPAADETGSSSSSSSSSSGSGSPPRSRSNSNSHSPSMSPPGSLSPVSKSPAPSSPQLSPARVSDAPDPHRPSISLTSVCSSPERARTVMSPSFTSGSASPNVVLESTPLTPVSDLVTSTSPERDFNKNRITHPIAFPRMINRSSDQRKASPSSSPSSASLSSSAASSPERGLNARINGSLAHPPPPAPPPPPPPPPPSVAVTPLQVESPAVSTPTDQPITSRPPALIPPSRPFVLQTSAGKVSPAELPPPAVAEAGESTEETPKPKLKPLHWDKVRASSDREMVWDHLRSSSFRLNEEMIETLFVVNTPTPKPRLQTTPRSVPPMANQDNRVLDPKKAQNIAILLRALNVTIEEVCEALLEGNTDTLGTELLESLLKMAPTKEEERKLKDYKDDSPTKLCHAEKFLKAVLDVPFAFKRAEAMLYVTNFETEIEYLKRSFVTLEVACEELRNSRMFLKLLEAVLKTGNRMNVGTNRGDAQAFKLDTLHKLVDVKGADGKTTLLHFVVQEIIRTEGARITGTNQNPSTSASEDAKCRKLGLQVVSSLSSELTNVKKAAGMDSDVLSSDVAKLSRGIQEITEVVRLNETLQLDGSRQKFSESMNRFLKMAEEEIIRIQAHESVALSLVKEITEYFHGNSAKEEAHPFRIFLVVRDFLGVLDRVCKEVGMINERTVVSSAHKFPVPVNPTLPQVFPGPSVARRDSFSDEESLSS